MPRLVLTPAERALKKQLHLDKWAKNEARRTAYFETIDMILERLTALGGEGDPSDRAVVAMLAVAASEDPSVTDHVLKRNVAQPQWDEISRTCAGVMYELHIRRCEEGKWPVM